MPGRTSRRHARPRPRLAGEAANTAIALEAPAPGPRFSRPGHTAEESCWAAGGLAGSAWRPGPAGSGSPAGAPGLGLHAPSRSRPLFDLAKSGFERLGDPAKLPPTAGLPPRVKPCQTVSNRVWTRLARISAGRSQAGSWPSAWLPWQGKGSPGQGSRRQGQAWAKAAQGKGSPGQRQPWANAQARTRDPERTPARERQAQSGPFKGRIVLPPGLRRKASTRETNP